MKELCIDNSLDKSTYIDNFPTKVRLMNTFLHIQWRQKPPLLPPQHTYINALVNQFYHYLLLKIWFTAVA
jgi:hypothetical protein